MAQLLDVRPEDRRNTTAAFLTLFGMMTAHAMLETARDALFLSSLPASDLPWAYLAIAGLAVGVTRINNHCGEACRPRQLLSASLVIAAVATAGMWLLTGVAGTASLYIFYVFTGLIATLVVVQFWLLLSDSFTVAQAKRVYALIGAGGLLGATAGSALAGGLLAVVNPRGLVLIGAGVFALTAIGPSFIAGTANDDAPIRRRPADEASTRGGLAFLTHPYLRLLTLIVVTTTVTVTAVDYVFKSVVAAEVEPARLGTFFAQYYAGLNALALVVQLFFASWLLRIAGVSRTLGIMPLLIFGSAVGFLAAPTLVLALLLRGTDGSLRHSVNRTSSELLYVPLPADLRHRFKGFIDVVGQRGGQALASLAILAAVAAGASTGHIAAGVAALACVWLLAILGIKPHYLELFRQQLRGGSVDVRVELPELDLHQLETLMAALNSEDDQQVIGALDMLHAHGKVNLIPALILYHPSRDVVLRALELFAEARRTDFSPVALRLMYGDDNAVRAAALRAKSAVHPEEDRLRQFLTDDSKRVRATAMVAIITSGFATPDEAEAGLREIIEHGDARDRIALAQAVRYQPDERLSWVLIELGRGSDPVLLSEVAWAIAAQPHLKYLNTLLRMLSMRRVRPAAREAILAIGPRALDFLDGALSDPGLDTGIRRHVPRSISKFNSQKAARILLAHLPVEPDGMTRFKILRGLGRMQSDNPRLTLDRAILRDVAETTLARIITVISWRRSIERELELHSARRTPGAELLVSLFAEKQENATERLFRLLGLLNPKEDFQLIYVGLTSANAKARASSYELLEHLLEPRMREAVLALVDDVPDEVKLARARDFHDPPELGYAELLRTMLTDPSEPVRCIAAYHIGEIGLDELRPQLAAVRPERASYLREVVEHALGLLSRRNPEASGHAG